MKQNNFAMVKAYDKSGVVEPSDEHIFGLKSGYVQRSLKTMPKQGNKDPWINYQDYLVDSVTLMLKGVEDKENLEFREENLKLSMVGVNDYLTQNGKNN